MEELIRRRHVRLPKGARALRAAERHQGRRSIITVSQRKKTNPVFTTQRRTGDWDRTSGRSLFRLQKRKDAQEERKRRRGERLLSWRVNWRCTTPGEKAEEELQLETNTETLLVS